MNILQEQINKLGIIDNLHDFLQLDLIYGNGLLFNYLDAFLKKTRERCEYSYLHVLIDKKVDVDNKEYQKKYFLDLNTKINKDTKQISVLNQQIINNFDSVFVFLLSDEVNPLSDKFKILLRHQLYFFIKATQDGNHLLQEKMFDFILKSCKQLRNDEIFQQAITNASRIRCNETYPITYFDDMVSDKDLQKIKQHIRYHILNLDKKSIDQAQTLGPEKVLLSHALRGFQDPQSLDDNLKLIHTDTDSSVGFTVNDDNDILSYLNGEFKKEGNFIKASYQDISFKVKKNSVGRGKTPGLFQITQFLCNQFTILWISNKVIPLLETIKDSEYKIYRERLIRDANELLPSLLISKSSEINREIMKIRIENNLDFLIDVENINLLNIINKLKDIIEIKKCTYNKYLKPFIFTRSQFDISEELKNKIIMYEYIEFLYFDLLDSIQEQIFILNNELLKKIPNSNLKKINLYNGRINQLKQKKERLQKMLKFINPEGIIPDLDNFNQLYNYKKEIQAINKKIGELKCIKKRIPYDMGFIHNNTITLEQTKLLFDIFKILGIQQNDIQSFFKLDGGGIKRKTPESDEVSPDNETLQKKIKPTEPDEDEISNSQIIQNADNNMGYALINIKNIIFGQIYNFFEINFNLNDVNEIIKYEREPLEKILNKDWTLEESLGCIVFLLFGAKRFGDWIQVHLARKHYFILQTNDFYCKMYAYLYGAPIIIGDNIYNYKVPDTLHVNTYKIFFRDEDEIKSRDIQAEDKLIHKSLNNELDVYSPISRNYFSKYLKYKKKYLKLKSKI